MPNDQQFRLYAIDAISREICALSGGVFETWAYALMALLAPEVHWHHRGTTALGAPVGYTVDSSGNQAITVAQFSSQKNYFSSAKPIEDLDGTVSKHQHTKEIWLVAAVESSPSERTETDNAIATWKIANPGIVVRDLDSRQIATKIVDNLESDTLVRALQDRLPSLARIADENAFSHSVPPIGSYVVWPEAEAAVQRLISSNRYAIVGGLSGVGKSALAVSVVHKCDAETLIWIDASEVSNSEELKSISVGRRGLSHNLAHILKTRRCALVLDNLKVVWPSEVFLNLVGQQSFIIASSQAAGGRDDATVLQNAPRDIAREILMLDGAPACSDETFESVWAATGGHPMLLRMLSTLASSEAEGWEAAVHCVDAIVSHGEDDRNEKVCRRVLKQHLPSVQDELGLFVWCRSPSIDEMLLEKCSSPMAKAKLEKRHFLAASTPRTIRLHDLVYKSAIAELPLEDVDLNKYRSRLDTIIREDTLDNLVTERVARRHHDLMLRELDRKHGWEPLYAAARARVSVAAIEYFERSLSNIGSSLGNAPPEVAVRAVIEAIEATYSLASEHHSRKDAQARLVELMPVFDFLQSLNLEPELSRDVSHHRAKMLTRLERCSEAEAVFRQLLQDSPEFHAAKLQLVRLLIKSSPDEACTLAQQLVEAPDTSPNVAIASWVELSRLNAQLVASGFEEISKVLSAVAAKDVAAAYGMVAQVGARLAYTRPDVTLRLFALIQDSDPVFSNNRERLDWARAQVVAGKALRDKADEGSAARLFVSARATYESVPGDRIPPFNRVQFAENLLLLKDFAQGRRELDLVPGGKDRSEFWWHRVAQAELGLGNAALAMIAIDAAIANLKDKKTYLATFLEVRSDVRKLSGDPNALDDLRSAIACVNDAKYLQQLTEKLAREVSVQ